MNIEAIILFILAICIGAIIGISIFARIAVKMKWNAQGVLKTADNALVVADVINEAIKPVIPANLSSITDKVIEYAKTAVYGAEQLYHIGTIQGDERKSAATDFIENALKVQGIEMTDEIKKVVDIAVEASVMALGHKTAA